MKAIEFGPAIVETPSINEIREGNTVRFECRNGETLVGAISLTQNGFRSYDVSGLFVDPSERGRGIGRSILQMVNGFLDREKSKGTLINMAHGDSEAIYANNGWVKTEFKSQGAYGGYEYVYDAREGEVDTVPRLGYCYRGFRVVGSERQNVNVIFRGSEKGKFFVFDGKNEYEAIRCSEDNEEPMFEFMEGNVVVPSEDLS